MFSVIFVVLAVTGHALGQYGGLNTLQLHANNANVVRAVQGINEFYSAMGDNAQRSLVRVVNAKSKIVAGTVYYLTLEVSGGPQIESCKLLVWERLYMQKNSDKRIIDSPPYCTPVSTLPPSTTPAPYSGFRSISVNSDQVQHAVGFAEAEFDRQSNYIHTFKALSISSASINETNSIVYIVKLKDVIMEESSCNKYDNKPQTPSCPHAVDPIYVLCDFTIPIVSWMYPQVEQTCTVTKLLI